MTIPFWKSNGAIWLLACSQACTSVQPVNTTTMVRGVPASRAVIDLEDSFVGRMQDMRFDLGAGMGLPVYADDSGVYFGLSGVGELNGSLTRAQPVPGGIYIPNSATELAKPWYATSNIPVKMEKMDKPVRITLIDAKTGKRQMLYAK